MSDHCQTCGGSCSTCDISEDLLCPVCGNKGFEVPYTTVLHLLNPELQEHLNGLEQQEFYLCTDRACKVVYYTQDVTFKVSEIQVPIWFKQDKSEYMICYCRRITLNDVKEAVQALDGDITKETVIEYLNKTDVVLDCLNNNPTGLPCDHLFDNAIKYAIDHK